MQIEMGLRISRIDIRGRPSNLETFVRVGLCLIVAEVQGRMISSNLVRLLPQKRPCELKGSSVVGALLNDRNSWSAERRFDLKYCISRPV
jgi:hypothetical protein